MDTLRSGELWTDTGQFAGILRLQVQSCPERYRGREPYSVRREYIPDGEPEPVADVRSFETRDAAEQFYRETVERTGRVETLE